MVEQVDGFLIIKDDSKQVQGTYKLGFLNLFTIILCNQQKKKRKEKLDRRKTLKIQDSF